jgi:glycopeptide antibiotics resistance protein
MWLEFFPYPLLAGLACLALLLILLWRRERKQASLVYFTLFWLYLLYVTSLIVFPIPLPGNFGTRDSAFHIFTRVNLVPFAFGGLFDGAPTVIFENLVGNILLTMPFGFGINFLTRLPARRIPWVALAVGLSLELNQLVVSLLIGIGYRGIDINDVILNAVGVLIGYGLFRMLIWLHKSVSLWRGDIHKV